MKTLIDIEKLAHWALHDQGLGWVGREGGQTDSLARLAELGTRIDLSPSGGLPPPSVALNDDPDAALVKDAIDRLPPDAAALIVVYGRTGLRPEWGKEGFGLPGQMIDKRGRLRWHWKDERKCRGKIAPMIDWRAYELRCDHVRFERATWTVWREALIALKAELAERLARFSPTGPMAPARPWAGLPDLGPVEIPGEYRMAGRSEWVNARASDWSLPGTEAEGLDRG